MATVNFYSGNGQFTAIKTKSIRKLSNLNFQWTKPWYQNNSIILHSAFFTFESYECNMLCNKIILRMTILPVFSQFLSKFIVSLVLFHMT